MAGSNGPAPNEELDDAEDVAIGASSLTFGRVLQSLLSIKTEPEPLLPTPQPPVAPPPAAPRRALPGLGKVKEEKEDGPTGFWGGDWPGMAR